MAASPYFAAFCWPISPLPDSDHTNYVYSLADYYSPWDNIDYDLGQDDAYLSDEDVTLAMSVATSYERTYPRPSPKWQSPLNSSSDFSLHWPSPTRAASTPNDAKSSLAQRNQVLRQRIYQRRNRGSEVQDRLLRQPTLSKLTSGSFRRTYTSDLPPTAHGMDNEESSSESDMSHQHDRARILHEYLRRLLGDAKAGPRTMKSAMSSSGDAMNTSSSLSHIQREAKACASSTFADVYKGSWQGQSIAIKKLHRFNARPDEADAFQEAFSRETQIWQGLRHPHVLPFLGMDQETVAPRLGLVSPWMIGGNVHDTMRDTKDPPVMDWLKQIADGMEYLHGRSCVHGDLRGANVLVDENMKVRLADFGLSVFANPVRYDPIKARWTAPELLDGTLARPNLRTDVYSFACLCVELLTRDKPFGTIDHDVDVVRAVLLGQRPDLPVDLEIPEDLWILMRGCWRESPIDRPRMPWVFSALHADSLKDTKIVSKTFKTDD